MYSTPKRLSSLTIGGYGSKAQSLPWAHEERPYAPSDFDADAQNDFASRIAAFAVDNGVNAVLAPTRPLYGPLDPWLKVDIKACEALRRALDAEGGPDIAVDYPLFANYETLRDEADRRAIVKALKDVPFENLWLRVSGFGSGATPVGVRRYINGARDFRALDKPIIADGVGGLVGLATVAFGSVDGIAHGIAEKERFDAKAWKKPRTSQSGGSPLRVYLPGMDIYLTIEQAHELFESRGAKSILACNDTSCCPKGIEDMLSDPKAHFLIQRSRQISELNRVPKARRADEFLRRQLLPAGNTARKVERLNLSNTKLAEKLRQQSRRLDQMFQVLDDLHRTSGLGSEALAPKLRARGNRLSPASGR